MTPLKRGRVYLAKVAGIAEPKYWLVVSPNRRNAGLGHALAVRITTSPKYTELESVVWLGLRESISGWARCDDIFHIGSDDVIRDVTALSRPTMLAVADGLKAALGNDR